MDKKQVPIYSAFEEDPTLREAIDEFVVRLAERVDLLQDAESTPDWPQLRALAELLAEDAMRLGFPDLSGLARNVCVACEDGKPDAAHDALSGATDVAERIRRGHRGAL